MSTVCEHGNYVGDDEACGRCSRQPSAPVPAVIDLLASLERAHAELDACRAQRAELVEKLVEVTTALKGVNSALAKTTEQRDSQREIATLEAACARKAEGQRDGLLAVLEPLVVFIDLQACITNSGGPNWAMRLQNDGGDRWRAAISIARGGA